MSAISCLCPCLAESVPEYNLVLDKTEFGKANLWKRGKQNENAVLNSD